MDAVIVHGGDIFPNYIIDCISQFFLFNSESNLYCIVDKHFSALESIANSNNKLKLIYTSELKKTTVHKFYLLFNRKSRSTWRGGFWRYVVERFFILFDFMNQYNLENLLHFEYDNLIYTNINLYKDAFVNKNKILLPSDNDNRCIPGIVFIPNKNVLNKFCRFFNLHFTLFPKNDMVAFSSFLNKKKHLCETLPVIPETYIEGKDKLYGLNAKNICKNPKLLTNGFLDFNIIFDAAALGQYIGGIDKRNEQGNTEGYVNSESAYQISDFIISWKNKNKLSCPYISYKDKEYPVFNLHMHSKRLSEFRSDIYSLT